MDVHSDKTLYKILILFLIIAYIPVMFFAYDGGGLKALIFSFWVFVAFTVFLFMLAKMLDAGTSDDSPFFFTSLLRFEMKSLILSGSLFLLLLALIAASIMIWNTLDHYMPSSKIEPPASQIPEAS